MGFSGCEGTLAICLTCEDHIYQLFAAAWINLALQHGPQLSYLLFAGVFVEEDVGVATRIARQRWHIRCRVFQIHILDQRTEIILLVALDDARLFELLSRLACQAHQPEALE